MAIPFGRIGRVLRLSKPSLGSRILHNRLFQTFAASAGTAGAMDLLTTGGGIAASTAIARRGDRNLQRQINQLRTRRRGF